MDSTDDCDERERIWIYYIIIVTTAFENFIIGLLDYSYSYSYVDHLISFGTIVQCSRPTAIATAAHVEESVIPTHE